MPVIDVRAIAQMARELQVLQNQLTTARNQLTQAQQQFESLTGRRGMEQLLSGVTRNYLPEDWATLEATLRGAQASYSALALDIQAALRGMTVLTPAQTAKMSEEQVEQLEAARRSVALMQATSREALQASSERFASLQELIDAIPTATDAKAVLDLQARIAAEQAMLQNEHTKLMVLNQVAEAEQRALEQRARELAISNFGSLRHLPNIGLIP
jgi:type IV secretion system protein VirB5